jgi:integrase
VREVGKGGVDRDKLISEDELHALLRAASHPRVKAFLAVLFESACRKGELKSLRIRDLSFGVTHAEIRVYGKTGERTVPLVFSVPYLRAWLQVHPDRRPEQWLFAFERLGVVSQMAEGSPNATIRYICRKADIRHIHPHMLRHTQLTQLARAGVGDYQMKGLAGWTPNSKMAGRYIHLSGRDHVDAVLESQGVPVPQRQRLKPMLSEGRCPQCDELIGASMLHCPKCGFILDPNVEHEAVERGPKEERLRALKAEILGLLRDIPDE